MTIEWVDIRELETLRKKNDELERRLKRVRSLTAYRQVIINNLREELQMKNDDGAVGGGRTPEKDGVVGG